MDFERNQTASSTISHPQAASSSSNVNASERARRSSSRIKAAKDKEDPAPEQASQQQARESSKGKNKEIVPEFSSTRSSKRARRATLPPTPAALIINEPPKDPKGKKRAIPESGSEDEAGPSTSSKRIKSGSYSRGRKEANATMPKKSKGTSKGRASLKGKVASGIDSTQFDGDNDMMDVDGGAPAQVDEDHVMDDEEDHDDDVATKVDKTDETRGDEPAQAASSPPDPIAEARRTMDDSGFSMFDFGRLGGYMGQLSGRLRGLLTNIKSSADPTTKLIALQELSELLSISTEDTLAGSFQVESFVRELVRIMGGTGGDAARDDGDGEDEDEQQDEDAALAAAISMSTGGALPGDENLEAQLLACRCLANLMEALPGSGHILAYHGAIPVLCSKLVEISYIDLAEQTLITLEKISEEHPSAIVREGGLAALLNYLDFFSIAVQRTALHAAANCLRSISADSFPMIKGVWPIIRNCLSYSDQRLVDYACLCVIRVIDSYHRSQSEKLEALVDGDLIRAVNLLLLPSAGSSIVPPNTIMLLIRALATAARASPTITITILQADLATTVYQILTGVLPATSLEESDEQGDSETGQGLGGGIADMAVVQNLSHRPKDQVEEALSLVSELMPPLPKDGVFDHKGYSEKALSRMIKAKAKSERAAAQSTAAQALLQNLGPSPSSSRAQSPTGGPSGSVDEDGVVRGTLDGNMDGLEGLPNVPAALLGSLKESTVNRLELLHSNSVLVNKFIRLMVPIMVDVYAASISVPSRIKSLASLLKAVCFQDSQQLRLSLKNVPVASFISSILSTKDHPNLMIGGLQLTEILLAKGGELYRSAFRREGVLHEIETMASRTLSQKSKEKEKEKEQVKEPDPGGEVVLPPPPVSLGRRTHILDPEDAYTLRGRVIRFKYLSKDEHDEADASLARLRRLVGVLTLEEAGDELLNNTLHEIASLFSTQHSLSSFELLQSGFVDALLRFASPAVITERVRRRKLLLRALAPVKIEKPVSSTSPLVVLVKKLQESLTRMESFEVITVTPGFEESKRNAPSLLARQIRLRLVAEDGADTPRGCSNIIVSIHGIATFQALNDYLRPRLSGILSSLGGSRFSSMLAAAVASGRFPPGTLPPSGFGLPPSDSQPAAGSSNPKPPGASDESKPERRRSMRLSAKASASSLAEKAKSNAPEPETSTSAAGPSDMATAEAMANLVGGSDSISNDDHDDFMDPEVDAEVFDEELEHEEGEAEKTVTLSVADDGTKIEAQTPDGTRVATPAPAKESAVAGPSTGSSASKASYAAALKNKANDWSLEFSMDDHPLPLDMTIYGAVHQHEARKAGGPTAPSSAIWSGVYTVKYKKVNVPRSPEGRQDVVEAPSRARSPIPALSSLADDAPHSKILKLLRVLHTLNAQIEDEGIANAQILAETSFINNKLTAKLARQLEEPLIVASSCLPDWAMDLPLHFPFLFPYSTRFSFLQSTSFGYARLILKWQSHHNRSQEGSRNRDETFGFLGRLQRQKVRISRKHILESAFKVFELYGSSSSILEVEYFDEVGTGLGPTLEFYSLVSREFARRDLKIWRDTDSTLPGPYVHHPQGLFPAPFSADDSEEATKRMSVFKIVGQFIAKAMLDSRIIDMSFNKIFLKYILSEDVPLTIANLRHIDPVLASSLLSVQNIASCGRSGNKDGSELTSVEDLMLDFTLPGYDIELRPGGKDISVTAENVHEYIREVLDTALGKGVEKQAKAFREGFSKVFPVNDLQAFSADELAMLFGSGEEDWSSETLFECIKADHGFSIENQSFRNLIGILSEFDKPARRSFLQFCTGSPKLPIGGFRGLVPPLTVVRKHHEAPLTADDYLPSVMTCLNYLKVPQYSSKTILGERLETAMKEGVGSFHLS